MEQELRELMDKLLAGEVSSLDFQMAWLSFEIRRMAALEARVAEEVKHMALMQQQAERQTKALETIAHAVPKMRVY